MFWELLDSLISKIFMNWKNVSPIRKALKELFDIFIVFLSYMYKYWYNVMDNIVKDCI